MTGQEAEKAYIPKPGTLKENDNSQAEDQGKSVTEYT